MIVEVLLILLIPMAPRIPMALVSIFADHNCALIFLNAVALSKYALLLNVNIVHCSAENKMRRVIGILPGVRKNDLKKNDLLRP